MVAFFGCQSQPRMLRCQTGRVLRKSASAATERQNLNCGRYPKNSCSSPVCGPGSQARAFSGVKWCLDERATTVYKALAVLSKSYPKINFA